ncbi:TetR family transcriptional regulator [Ochrobactrum sp. S46]|nr:TetR family transcriptional regulator [Ochrobactrum sp. S45]MBK0046138.1 TetR family transcriptional regulator [Ochrobactrum sp. S46]
MALSRTRPARKNDPDATKQNILDVATKEFVDAGFSGARVDAIAERTRTSKRMLYYYFGNKEGLYLAVLEQAYSKIRKLENTLNLSHLEPDAAMRSLVTNTFDHDDANPDFVQLVSIENIHRAEHLKNSELLLAASSGVIHLITDILERGEATGVFTRKIDPVDLHQMISAQCFFRVSNRHTFGAIFGRDLMAEDVRARHREMVADLILAYLKS